MKYIKLYEIFETTFEKRPEIGDYVLLRDYINDTNYSNFVTNNVGQVIGIKYKDKYSTIKYYNVPQILIDKDDFVYDEDHDFYTRTVHNHNIDKFSKNKNEIELYILSNKYNL